MTFNTIPMIQEKVQTDFDALLTLAQSPEAAAYGADDMERHLFRQLLAMGAQLMQLFLTYRSQIHQREVVVGEKAEEIPYHSERKRDYYSVFGKLAYQRPYFYRQGSGGRSPLDAALGMGADSYSDFLRELHEELSAHVPYEKTQTLLGRLLGIHLSKRVQQQLVTTDATDVDAYYEQKVAPPASEEASILVAQADGKGVPIVRPSQNSRKVRLRRGEARSRKKAVVVSALYTIQPAVRTADDVLRTLLQEVDESERQFPERYRPQHKQIRGTLQGKDVALERLAQQIAKREGEHIQHRVALCDGDQHLQAKLQHHLPDFTLILDFIHAYEYLWKAVTCLYGEKHPERLPWIRQQTQLLLTSRTPELIEQLRRLAEEDGRTAYQQKLLHKVAGYLEKNQDYMDYAACLRKGWPIASGVIEGACRHFVKDRMELSGMRWTETGAENLLRLRAVAENDDWDDYHDFRKLRRQQRLHNCAWPITPLSTAGPPTFSSPTPIVQPSSGSESYQQLPLVA
jgi:hypothetical protein